MVAAGQGRRLGSGEPGAVPKQYREIGGVPMVVRAVRPFAAHREVAQVVVVLPPGDAADPPDFLAALAGPAAGSGTRAASMLTFVGGGCERTDSVRAGLAALNPDCRVVLVHDAARPFVDADTIHAVIRTARTGIGAVAAVPVADTLKEAADGDAGRVARTVPRERLWRAQTPQGFPRELIVAAYARAADELAVARRTTGGATSGAAHVGVTDDAALVERLGAEVRLVPGSPANLKITTPADFAWAESWAAQL